MSQKAKAFTLMEILIVIVIIAVMSAFVFIAMSETTNKTNDEKREVFLTSCHKALEEYILRYNVTGSYPIESGCIVEALSDDLFYCSNFHSSIDIPETENILYNDSISEEIPKGTWYISQGGGQYFLYTYLDRLEGTGYVLSYGSGDVIPTEILLSEIGDTYISYAPSISSVLTPYDTGLKTFRITIEDGNLATDISLEYYDTDTPGTVYIKELNGVRSGTHTIQVPEILNQNEYYFSVSVNNGKGTDNENGTFTTGVLIEPVAPVILSVNEQNITQNGANIVVSFTDGGDGDSTLILDWGLSSAYTEEQIAEHLSSGEYTFSLSTLSQGETYYYKVTIQNSKTLDSDQGSFTTTDASSVITNVSVTNISESQATINFDIVGSEDNDVTIDYGTDLSYGQMIAYYSQSAGSHSYQLTDLASAVSYYYKITVVGDDEQISYHTGSFRTFRTMDLVYSDITSISATGTVTFNTGSTEDVLIECSGGVIDLPYQANSSSPVVFNLSSLSPGGTYTCTATLGGTDSYSKSFYATPFTCIATTDTCDGADILHLYDPAGGHAELNTQSNYAYKLCCSGLTGISSANTGSSAVVLKLYSETNAHVEKNTQSNYTYNAYISAPDKTATCEYATNCNTLGNNYACVASISSGDTNLHIGECGAFLTKVCCKIE